MPKPAFPAIVVHKADPGLVDLLRLGQKAEAFEQVCGLLDELRDVELALQRLARSKVKDKFTRQVELEERLRLTRGLLQRLRQRWES